jgi:hypothetical protein
MQNAGAEGKTQNQNKKKTQHTKNTRFALRAFALRLRLRGL